MAMSGTNFSGGTNLECMSGYHDHVISHERDSTENICQITENFPKQEAQICDNKFCSNCKENFSDFIDQDTLKIYY